MKHTNISRILGREHAMAYAGTYRFFESIDQVESQQWSDIYDIYMREGGDKKIDPDVIIFNYKYEFTRFLGEFFGDCDSMGQLRYYAERDAYDVYIGLRTYAEIEPKYSDEKNKEIYERYYLGGREALLKHSLEKSEQS